MPDTATAGGVLLPEQLRIRLQAQAGGFCLLVAGEIDVATAYLLGKVTGAVLATRHTANLTMDMSAVTFIDAAGIAAVIGCHRQAAQHRRPFFIVNPSRAVTAKIGLCGVEHLLAKPLLRRLDAQAPRTGRGGHRGTRPPSPRPRTARP